MPTIQNTSLFATAILAALIAGLFYSYSCSVNIGLNRLPDDQYLAAMQSINVAILNPMFFLSFMGSLIMLPLSAWLSYKAQHVTQANYLITAAAVYIIGAFGVTIFGNVPLNDQLAQFDLATASAAEIKHQRVIFEIPWNKLHSIRTLASILSLALVVIACMLSTTNQAKN